MWPFTKEKRPIVRNAYIPTYHMQATAFWLANRLSPAWKVMAYAYSMANEQKRSIERRFLKPKDDQDGELPEAFRPL